MSQSIQEISTKELRMLVDFSRSLVIKAQEDADAAETAALLKAGITYTQTTQETRDWVQLVGYAVPGTTTVEVRKSASWLYRKASSLATVYAKDLNNDLWEKIADFSWINIVTGQVRATVDASWATLNAPAGEVYIDGTGFRVLLPIMIWYDRTSGDTSSTGPGSGEFIGDSATGILIQMD